MTSATAEVTQRTLNLDPDPGASATRFRGRQPILIWGALIMAVVVAHLPVLSAGFVWDDTALVLRDPLIRSWRLIPEGFQHFLFTDATPSNFYRPLQRLTYTLEYWSFGFAPLAFHLTNVLLHAAAAIALFAFSSRLLKSFGISGGRVAVVAALGALAWALHPVHSAVVDYVSGRADSLAALFGFCGLYCAVRAFDSVGPEKWLFNVLAASALLASALSKESGLIFGLLWLVLTLMQRQRRTVLPVVIGLTFAATIYFTLRSQVQGEALPQLTPPAPAVARPIIAARALAEYVTLLCAPSNLHVERDVESHPWGAAEASMRASAYLELQTAVGVALTIALMFWLLRARKTQPAVFVLLALALLTYLPVSGLFRLNATMAEHWLYLPSAFFLLAIAMQFEKFARVPVLRRVLTVASILWVTCLGLRAFVRAQDWKDQRTFLERTIAAGGNSARMLINLGALELAEGKLDRAEATLNQALKKQPEQPFALLNLSAIAIKRNDFARARTLLDRARRQSISKAQAEEMFAVVEYKQTGAVDLLRLRLASRTPPYSWLTLRRYVQALDQTGATARAVAELEALNVTEWYRAESWCLLAGYLSKLGRASAAESAMKFAREFDVHLPARRS